MNAAMNKQSQESPQMGGMNFYKQLFFLDFLKAEFDGGLNGVRVMGRTANHPVVMDEHF